MSPKSLIAEWVERFNAKDATGLAELYSDDAVNHQVANEEVRGRENIRRMFETEFSNFEMVCLVENIFEDGNVGMLEWVSPGGLRGCGFFWFEDSKIILQRGYWDKASFQKEH